MEYRFERDDLPSSRRVIRAIAILVKCENKDDPKSFPEDNGYVWLGHYRDDGIFQQNDHICLEVEDIKLLAHAFEQIENEGFDKIYNESPDRPMPEENISDEEAPSL